MMSKVLFAFLGTADYLPCNYLLNGREINNVRFVQEAIASLLCKDWTEEDRIVIFLTEDACSRNWTDNSQIDPNGKILQREGLKSRLESLNLKAEIHPKDVPNGQSESEIWEIFDIVFNQINSDDEVIFDITHSFRSLPLLVTIILNYARILKKIKIRGMYYGAFESLGTLHDVKKIDIEDRNAPIFDLTSFIYLFNWTSAIDDFLTYGDAKDINLLTNEEMAAILKDTKGKDIGAQNLQKLGVQLNKFSELIQTSRGLSIIRNFDFNNLMELIKINKESILKPINPLLDGISNKIETFNNGDINNGYAAVEWCINHNLIQQGYTILQETMTSEIVAKHFGNNEIANRDKRKLVSHAINIKNRKIPEIEWEELTENNRTKLREIMDDLDDDFVKIYDSVTQYRNDIDHAGFRDNPSKPRNLKNGLMKYYMKLIGGRKYV